MGTPTSSGQQGEGADIVGLGGYPIASTRSPTIVIRKGEPSARAAQIRKITVFDHFNCRDSI